MHYSVEPRERRYIKGYGFLSFARNFSNKYGKKLMNTAIKTGANFNSKYGKKLADTAIKILQRQLVKKQFTKVQRQLEI